MLKGHKAMRIDLPPFCFRLKLSWGIKPDTEGMKWLGFHSRITQTTGGQNHSTYSSPSDLEILAPGKGIPGESCHCAKPSHDCTLLLQKARWLETAFYHIRGFSPYTCPTSSSSHLCASWHLGNWEVQSCCVWESLPKVIQCPKMHMLHLHWLQKAWGLTREAQHRKQFKIYSCQCNMVSFLAEEIKIAKKQQLCSFYESLAVFQ